ncbi:MAG: hypothetical protein R3C15_14325 [Thermoleophilia bacterium]
MRLARWLALGALAALVPGTAAAQFAGRNGAIAFVRDEQKVLVVPLDGSAPRELTGDVAGEGDPAVTPDGAQVVFSSDREGVVGLFVAPLAGGATRRVSPAGLAVSGWALSPDGTTVVFAASPDPVRSPPGLWLVRADGTEAHEIADVAPLGRFAWAPDSSRLAFWCEGGVWLIGADGSGLRRLRAVPSAFPRRRLAAPAPGRLTPVMDLAWRPDGLVLALPRVDGRSDLVDVATGHVLARIRGAVAAWTRDVGTLALVRSGEIWLAGPDGAAPRRLTGLGLVGRLAVGGVRFSPDGRTVVLVASAPSVQPETLTLEAWTVRVDGTGLRRRDASVGSVYGPARPQAPGLAWSADGSALVLAHAYATGTIAAADPADGVVRRLARVPGLTNRARLAWSPDGSALAFDQGDGIAVLRADGSGLRQVLRLGRTGHAPTWSPDGTQLAFLAGVTNVVGVTTELRAVRVKGGAERLLGRVSGRYVASAPSWSPDGGTIAFARLDRILRPGFNGSPVQRLFGVPAVGGPVRRLAPVRLVNAEAVDWRPDGTEVAAGTQIVRPGSGARRPLTSEQGAQVSSWSPDGRQLAVLVPRVTGAWIGVIEADGSGLRLLAPAGYAQNVAWQPLPG